MTLSLPSIISFDQVYSSLVSASIVAALDQHTRKVDPISKYLKPKPNNKVASIFSEKIYIDKNIYNFKKIVRFHKRMLLHNS